MRAWTKVWVVIVAVCAGLTVYEIPNARLVWRCASMARRLKKELVPKEVARSILTDEIAAADPEAADILRYCLGEPNDYDLADLVAKYPQNEFFLAQMLDKITEANLIDARAPLALTDRLIALSPDNAHYRYLKGWIFLKPPRDAGREQETLEQFEFGNKAEDFYLPYSFYKQRVDTLSELAGLSPLERRLAEPREGGVYRELTEFIARAYGVYPKLDRESFRRLSAAFSQVAERLIDNAEQDGCLGYGHFLLVCCETARLRHLDLSPAEARQNRFRLCQTEELKKVLGEQTIALIIAFADVMKVVLAASVFTAVVHPLLFLFVWLFLVVVNRLRGRAQNVSVGVKAPVLLVAGLVGVFGLTILYGLLIKLSASRFLAALAFLAAAAIMWICLVLLAPISPSGRTHFEPSRGRVARVCGVLWILGAIADAIACSLVLSTDPVARYLVFSAVLVCWSALCVLVWAVVAYRHHVFGGIPNQGPLNSRFAQLLLVLLLMTAMTGFVRPLPVVPWVLGFLTILFVGLAAAHAPLSRLACLRAARHIFSRDGEIVATRTKLARMMSTILLLVWIVGLAGVHISAGKLSQLKSSLTDTLATHRPLPQANRETYERVLSRKYTDDPNARVRTGFKEDVGLPMELHLISPEDLRAIISERYAANKPIREKMLLELMRRGGHDIRPLVVETLKDPNALDVLIRRAEWGEMSVKDQLERIFQNKMVELAETTGPIRQDPNSIRSLIIRVDWGDETARGTLTRAFQTRLVQVSKRIRGQDHNSDLRSDLMLLQEMESVLYRSSSIRQLIIDANMPELLKPVSRPQTSGRELLTSLFEIAGALAFISDPQEAKARFSDVIDLVAPMPDDPNRPDLPLSAGVLLRAWAGGYRECLFYRALTGVPKPQVTALLKEYIHHRRMSDPFNEIELLDVFARAGDRELAEWIFRSVAESRPTVQVSDYPDLVPTLQPINISDLKGTRVVERTEDRTDRYLEPTFPYLGPESIPLLLEHLDSDNDQLRAFVVWRMTSLGYQWTDEQLAAIRQDSYWKVRLNALFALDRDDLATAIEDESPLVRVVVRMLIQFDSP